MASEDDSLSITQGGLASFAILDLDVSAQFPGPQVRTQPANTTFSLEVTDASGTSNLSQARLGSLEKDLGMKGTDYNLATSILFVGYLLMQLPSNLLLTQIRPSLFLGIAMAIW